MFTEDDAERIEEIKANEISNWSQQLELLIGKPVPIEVDWESTYTFSPVLEPDFGAAGAKMIEAFELACQNDHTRTTLAAEVNQIEFLSVAPHIGFGAYIEDGTLCFRTTVYPKSDGTELSVEDYADLIRSSANELAPEPTTTDSFSESPEEMIELDTVGEQMDMGPDTASLVLAFSFCGISTEDEADAGGLNELMMRHYTAGSVMEAQMVVMMSSLGAGLGAMMEEGLTGTGDSNLGAKIMGDLEKSALEVLDRADREVQLKAVALGLKVALLDNVITETEQATLDRLLAHFGLSAKEVNTYVDEHMQVTDMPSLDELTAEEATFMFATMIAECENREPDPSSVEGEVISSIFDMETIFGLMAKLPDTPPDDLPEGVDPISAYFTPKVMPTLKSANDEERLRALAIGIRVANADGEVTAGEEETLAHYCTALGHDIKTARAWGEANLPPSTLS